MPTPYESAKLNLKLYDLRREPALREARAWFVGEFHPTSVDDLINVMSTDRNASVRMVLGYWDMAASLVTFGAIDAEMFRAAHGEIIATFAKIQPYLQQFRTQRSSPNFCKHMEAVVTAMPDSAAAITRMRAVFQGMAAQQAAARNGKGKKPPVKRPSKARARAR